MGYIRELDLPPGSKYRCIYGVHLKIKRKREHYTGWTFYASADHLNRWRLTPTLGYGKTYLSSEAQEEFVKILLNLEYEHLTSGDKTYFPNLYPVLRKLENDADKKG